MKMVLVRLNARDVDFHFDNVRVDPVYRRTEGFIEHAEERGPQEP
jgi:hypothetical protein